MFPVSAEHGRGIDDLLDAVFEILPPKEITPEDTENSEDPEEPSKLGDESAAETEPGLRNQGRYHRPIPTLASPLC